MLWFTILFEKFNYVYIIPLKELSCPFNLLFLSFFLSYFGIDLLWKTEIQHLFFEYI